MAVPKYKRPAKVANTWPGKYHVGFNHPGMAYPWKFTCPAPLCFMSLVADTEEKIDARIESHPCPWFGGGTTHLSWSVMSDDYLAPIWEMLDKHMDAVYDESASSEARYANREVARGLAYSLAILMPPFFDTAAEIINEAKVRYEKRKTGEDYETPGLGRLRWKRPDKVIGDPNNPSWVTKPEYDAKAPPEHKLTDAEVEAIRKSKGFPIAMLATAYNTTPKVIEYLQKG